MQKIKKLSPLQIQKIAAGEVVERPSNVLKELIENSLDADSNSITIYIEEGGKKKIRIIDNGCGMSIEDARLCIEDHATSKIVSAEDLTNIETFGFRGEALASISAVSNLTIVTREKHALDQDHAIKLEISDGKIQREMPVSANPGTDICIENLFYNLPARRKFLKTKDTEWRLITQLFTAFCLDYINVSFKLYHDDKLIYNYPKVETLESRALQIFDYSVSKKLLYFSDKQERMNLEVSGVISEPNYNRYDKSEIYVFVNKRWIKNYKLANALIKGFQNMLPVNKYPLGVLFINISPEFVDINIHPKKEEVQFLHPVVVENTIESAIQRRLEEYQSEKLGIKPASLSYDNFNIPVITPKVEIIEDYKFNFEEPVFKKAEIYTSPEISFKTNPFNINVITNDNLDQILESKKNDLHIQEKIESEITIDYRLVGQIFNTYILIETEQGLTVIDQHGAHERIMYEKLKNNFNNTPLVPLLFGQVINLNKSDTELVEPYLSLFKYLGISLEPIDVDKLIVKETAVFLKGKNIEDIVKEAISWIKEGKSSDIESIKKIVQEKIHAKISCVSSIRAGDALNNEMMNSLIKDLYNTDNKLTCPHGRPTIWPLELSELEKKFKRDYRN